MHAVRRERLVGLTLLLGIVVLVIPPGPVDAQAPTPSVALRDRPMLAPEGWMYATITSRREGQDQLQVVAVSPAGEMGLVATIIDPWRPLADGTRVRDASEWYHSTRTVTVDGFLPLAVTWDDDAGEMRYAVRVHDLLAPDPSSAVTVLPIPPGGALDSYTLRSGPDGRISVIYDAGGVGAFSSRQGTVVLDPVNGSTVTVPPSEVGDRWRGSMWLQDGSGWIAGDGERPAVLGVDGVFRMTQAPHPLVDLARGGEQVSTTGHHLTTYDVGASAAAGRRSFSPPCRLWWDQPSWDDSRPRRMWWSRCTDPSRPRGVRWDVDGRGILAIVEYSDRLELVRRDRPGGPISVLATLRSEALTNARRTGGSLSILGLAPGPAVGELLLAFTFQDRAGSVFFVSTVDRRLTEVRGIRHRDGVTFAGFSVPPIDRNPTIRLPQPMPSQPIPAGVLAPDGWMLAVRVSEPDRAAAIDATVLAVSPAGRIRRIATLEGINRGREAWSLSSDLESLMTVSATGVLSILLSQSVDAGDPIVLRLFDLLAPERPPIEVVDGPGRIHDWTTLRSASDGTLSVRIDDEGAYNGRHVLLEIDPTDGSERVIPYLADIEPEPDFLADSTGWPATRSGAFGILRRSDGLFLFHEPRSVSLARGAVQQARRVRGLSRVVSGRERGDPGCRADAIVSGPDRGPSKVWWDSCRDPGTVLDHRMDVDGDGLLFLVQRAGRIEVLRSDRPGRQKVLASVPVRLLGGREPIDRLEGLRALMKGPRPGELLLAFTTARGVWFWSTLEPRPVLLPDAGVSTRTWFAGFSVPPGGPR